MRYRTPEQKKAHRARVMKWRAEHPDKHRESVMKYRTENYESYRASKRKWQAEHTEECNAAKRKYRNKHLDEIRDYRRKYDAESVNNNGVTKKLIRKQSRHILFMVHSKLTGYEIHHCFGYEDPNRFIYIPKVLHLQIHQLLRDNNILADSDHWNSIRDLVNSYEGYTYIRT